MAELESVVNESTETTEVETVETETGDNADLARLKAELAKQKAALDKAMREAGDYRKQLRAKQSAEEVAAEEAKALQQSMQEELETLRKEKVVDRVTAKVMTAFGAKDADAKQIGEDLYGAADADAALDALAKAWAAKEKALRMEFGRIPAPGVGGADGPSITKEQLDGMSYLDRIEFANKHPDEYNRLMGRT